jgi:hypothetical protein
MYRSDALNLVMCAVATAFKIITTEGRSFVDLDWFGSVVTIVSETFLYRVV